MAFRIKRNEPAEAAIQRIATEQIDKAIHEIEDDSLGPHETIHQVRKRTKKLRALLRLVRPQLGKVYKRENKWYRDAARLLSSSRDAQSRLATFDTFIAKKLDTGTVHAIGAILQDERDTIANDTDTLNTHLREFHDRLCIGRDRIGTWQIEDSGFDAIAGGLEDIYAQGRRNMDQAYTDMTGEAFHEWRKRVKDHWYHIRILRPAWQRPMRARGAELKCLADFLGDDHDLAVLRAYLEDNTDAFGSAEDIAPILERIEQQQSKLRTKAQALGQRIYAEKPKAFRRRIQAYWHATNLNIPEPPG